MHKRLLTVIALLVVLGIGCDDGRPSESDARQEFERLYPGAQITSIRISENEVVARSFRFRYRKPGNQSEKEISIQFMRGPEEKKWVPTPKPPDLLP
jgi:hypothetical protein